MEHPFYRPTHLVQHRLYICGQLTAQQPRADRRAVVSTHDRFNRRGGPCTDRRQQNSRCCCQQEDNNDGIFCGEMHSATCAAWQQPPLPAARTVGVHETSYSSLAQCHIYQQSRLARQTQQEQTFSNWTVLAQTDQKSSWTGTNHCNATCRTMQRKVCSSAMLHSVRRLNRARSCPSSADPDWQGTYVSSQNAELYSILLVCEGTMKLAWE